MKIKHLFIFGLIAILFFSCDPNKKVYEDLDAAQKPYNEQLSYTLKNADYTTIKKLALKNATNSEDSTEAYDLAKFKSFSETRSAQKLIPAFLGASFIALDSASSAAVTYNYSNQFTFTPSQKLFLSGVFTSIADVETALLSAVNSPKEGDYMLVSYQFNDGTTTKLTKGLFQYDGTAWTNPADSYVLDNADFESMGTDAGEPGSVYYFSSAIPAEDYLPTFLKLKYPYALSGKTAELVYKFNNNGMYYYYDLYTFDGQKWNNIEQKTSSFVQNGTAWFFDPTVRFKMSESDYQKIVDWVINTDSIKAYAPYANSEYYYGASTYHSYDEFDMQLGTRKKYDFNGYLTGLSDDDIKTVIWGRIQHAVEYVLEQDYPNSVATVNGIPVYYEVSFKTYEPPAHIYMIRFKCTGAASFEYVDGPTLIQ